VSGRTKLVVQIVGGLKKKGGKGGRTKEGGLEKNTSVLRRQFFFSLVVVVEGGHDKRIRERGEGLRAHHSWINLIRAKGDRLGVENRGSGIRVRAPKT